MSAGTAAAVEHRLGPLEEIPVGEGRCYAVDGRQVVVFRLRSGVVRATSATCPHRGGPIADGQVDEKVVVCPLHAYAFVLETGRRVGDGEVPAPAPGAAQGVGAQDAGPVADPGPPAMALEVYPARVDAEGTVLVAC